MIKARDRHDRIIVAEKLDGSNVAVALHNGDVLALGRAGYLASTSKYEQHQFFAHWVREREELFRGLLSEGERVNGEWLAQAHGTVYELPHEPFVAFDIMREADRLPWDEVASRCLAAGIVTPRILSDGPPVNIEAILPMIETSGHGAKEAVEGAVWRVERHGSFDFMAKWVRQDKIDGKYLPEISGSEPIWHWRPNSIAKALAERDQ